MFYENVKRLCADRGISITSLAIDLGFSRSAPSTWKIMTNPPRAVTVKKVAEYFSVPPETLTDGAVGQAEKQKYNFDAQTNEMIALFEPLSVVDKAKVLIFTSDLIKSKKEK